VRNAKVRQRIAAGKLRLRIRDLRNLGMRCEQQLTDIGLGTVEALRRHGAVSVFVQMKRAGLKPSLNFLWALAGALDPWPEGTHWREVARGDNRLSLLLAVEDLEAELAARDVARTAP
jgi:DNA transformation protein